MRRARGILVRSLPLLALFSVGIPAQILPGSRDADSVRISRAQTVEGRDPTSSAGRGESMLGTEIGPVSISAESAQAPGDCWIVQQWTEVIDGRPYLCTKWLCDDGRTWTECVPI